MVQFDDVLRNAGDPFPIYRCGDCGYKVINKRCNCFTGNREPLQSDLDHYLDTGWHLLPTKELDRE